MYLTLNYSYNYLLTKKLFQSHLPYMYRNNCIFSCILSLLNITAIVDYPPHVESNILSSDVVVLNRGD